MSETLTIRVDSTLKAALDREAAQRGKTPAEAANEVLRSALLETSIEQSAGYLRGKLDLQAYVPDEWQETLRERNWRP